MYKSFVSIICALTLVAPAFAKPPNEKNMAAGQLNQDDLKQIIADLHEHIPVLASDEYGGRAPATRGEELTLAYLAGQFKAMGLEPGNGDSYLQQVPVTESITSPDTTLSVRGKDFEAQFSYGDEMIAFSEQQVAKTALTDSPMVFVGYGIVAPERDWNDYAGVDVRGKTVVILINDPGYASQDESLFNGNAMTWYGRWVYKYEEAARQGAAGALIIHETGAAAYGWDVVYSSWSRPQISLTASNLNADKSEVIGWLSQDSARALFAAAGLDYAKQVAAAARPGFRAVPMGDLTASITLDNTLRNSVSNNVIAVIPGSERPDESIIYTAHWDHLGTNPKVEGDNIYNGAVDNASGTAALLSLARLFSELPARPERSVAFLAVTAEESGLLGSRWYSENPLFPLETTVANINIDGMVVDGPMRDVVVVGYGNSELDDYLRTAVSRQKGRYVDREPHPERGGYYRSDHFNFARVGVPALYAESGEDSFDHGREWGAQQSQEYTAKRYHSPLDEYDPSWDLSGAGLDIMLYFDIGLQLSMESTFPNWSESNEFKAIRDASASARGK
ncbi:MAG: M28 family peptidase [Halioglobus sp.]|nr:M28 family peptidase [Halioglobus sp.]